MQTTTLESAVERIPNGARLMIGGFMGVGTNGRLRLVETAESVSVVDVQAATEAALEIAAELTHPR